MKRMLVVAVIAVAVASSCGPGSGARVTAYFADVGDLVERATVQVNDVEVGSIDAISLVNRDGRLLAKVEMDVSPGTRISADDLSAVVRQTSLLGEQFVELIPGTGGPPFLGAGAEVTIPVERTDRRVDVETFLADLSGLVGSGGLEDLNRFTNAQAMILEQRGDEFGATIEELERFTTVLSNRGGDIGRAIDSLASAGRTIAADRATLDAFLDSLEEASTLLADQGDELGELFRGLANFGEVNARFLSRHEESINRQFKALRPILRALASTEDELRADIAQLRLFFELFPRSFGGGPGDRGEGDYIQADAVLCEVLAACNTNGEEGDVPGQGSE
jgi:phospholipid/cholesterol/gamma-HCH transport system substrate-binding protein